MTAKIFICAVALFYLVNTLNATDSEMDYDESFSVITAGEREKELQLNKARTLFQKVYYNLAIMKKENELATCTRLYTLTDADSVNLRQGESISRTCNPQDPISVLVSLEELGITDYLETILIPCDCKTEVKQLNIRRLLRNKYIYITKVASHTNPKQYFIMVKKDEVPNIFKIIAQENIEI